MAPSQFADLRSKSETNKVNSPATVDNASSYLELADRLELHRLARQVLLRCHGVGENVEQEGAGARSVHSERNDIPYHRLHDESFERDGVEGVLVGVVELQVVVEDQAALHVRWPASEKLFKLEILKFFVAHIAILTVAAPVSSVKTTAPYPSSAK